MEKPSCFTCTKAVYDHPLAMKVKELAKAGHAQVPVITTSDIRFCTYHFNRIVLIGVRCWAWRAKKSIAQGEEAP